MLTNGFLGWMVGAKLALDDKKKTGLTAVSRQTKKNCSSKHAKKE